jgi:hypothetical protein
MTPFLTFVSQYRLYIRLDSLTEVFVPIKASSKRNRFTFKQEQYHLMNTFIPVAFRITTGCKTGLRL